MKFSISIKVFIILLAFSLGPILVSRTLTNRTVVKEVEKLVADIHFELLNIVSTEIENNAVNLLNYLEARGQAFSLGVRAMARQAEHRLYWKYPDQDDKPIMAGEFGKGQIGPPGSILSDLYLKRTRNGGDRPMLVDFDNPAFHSSSSIMSIQARDQMQRLAGMDETLKEIYEELGSPSSWLNIGLETGVLASYPGHGGFPMRYDHRNQPWYRLGKTSIDEAKWNAPAIDPSTGGVVTTVTSAIRNKAGDVVGVAAIDVPAALIISDVDLRSEWGDDIETFMVVKLPKGEAHPDSLMIVAQRNYGQTKRHHWMAGVKTEYLVSDDEKGFAHLLRAMEEKTSGLIRLSYKGRDSVWAFASNDDFSFLIIAPKTLVSELPNEVAGYLDYVFGELRTLSSTIVGVMLILTCFIAWFGSKRVTKPMLLMANAAKRLARGDFSVRLNMRTGDERDELINSFNDMVPKLKERLLMRKDMELAHQVQQLLLPKNEPSIRGFDISGGISFCDQTGGDYYDFIEVENGEGKAIGVVLGDVSGHGVASALLMATARGQLHSLAKSPLRPAERIKAINDVLSRDMDGTGRFLTLFYLRLIEQNPNINWVRAGHDPAIRYTPEKDEFSELVGEGLPIGVLEGFEYEDCETTLTSGEVLVLATDGVWESRSLEGEMFGKKRMLAIIRENAHKSAEAIRTSIMEAVHIFEGNGQEDDIAVVVIKKD